MKGLWKNNRFFFFPMVVRWPTGTQSTHLCNLLLHDSLYVLCECLYTVYHILLMKQDKKDMATQWFSWRTFWPRCPRRRWRGTCWRWSSSPWPGWGCTRPWCGHAALWSVWKLGRCHLWTQPRHRGSCCARTLHLLSSTSPERRLQNGPFCQKQTTREGRQGETDRRVEGGYRLLESRARCCARCGSSRVARSRSALVHHLL